jgi:KDO2-lipid IV(A) lauroyltransferase
VGTGTIVRGAPSAGRALRRALRGGVLGLMIDQDTRVEGTWVPFFGRPAYTPLGPAQLAQRLGAALAVSFIERLPDGSHLLRVSPPLEPEGGAEELTRTLTAAVEEQIRRVPEQWVWMHRRWRRQPPEAS